MTGQVQHRADGPRAWVTLNHPGKFNAMSRAMWRELRLLFEQFQQDRGLRCIIVRGWGGNFCAGGDIAEYPDFRFTPEGLRAFHEDEVWGGLQAMLDCDVPVVAQIEGYCMGAGLEMASCCDIRIADASARFAAPIARLGFPMAPKEAALVARSVGDSTARAMLLAAEVFDAGRMLHTGWLSEVCPSDKVAQQALAVAHRVVALAPQAARLNKQTFRELNRPLASVDIVRSAIVSEATDMLAPYAYAASAEHREGIAAFLDKRKPEY